VLKVQDNMSTTLVFGSNDQQEFYENFNNI